jgi:hypothetical protein
MLFVRVCMFCLTTLVSIPNTILSARRLCELLLWDKDVVIVFGCRSLTEKQVYLFL